MAERTHLPTNRPWGRFGGVLFLGIVVGVGGPLWINWPKRTRDRFVACVSVGRYGEAQELLADPAAITHHENGEVTFMAPDRSSVTLARTDLPLRQLDDFYSRPNRNGLKDFVAGRYQFGMATAGADVLRERVEPTEIQVDAVRGRVAIVRIVRH